MKVLIVDTYYENFLAYVYRRYPYINKLSYENHRRFLLDLCFGTSDFYSRNLNDLGFSAEDVIFNNKYLQKEWAKENKKFYPTDLVENIIGLRIFFANSWQKKIFWSQFSAIHPSIVYVQDLTVFNPDELKKIKENHCLLLGQSSTAFPDPEVMRKYDLVLTALPQAVNKIKMEGVNIKRLDLCFEERILKKIRKQKKRYDVSFIGGFSRYHLKNPDFLETFEYLANNTSVDFWGYGIKNLSLDSPIRESYHGEAWGIEMYNILYNSKISINRHIPLAGKSAVNMRLYESTGVGTMLITDYKDNLHELFKVGKEVETYRSKEELVDKIKYYLSHEDKREKIAKAGQQRTLKDHTYRKRMAEVAKAIEKCL